MGNKRIIIVTLCLMAVLIFGACTPEPVTETVTSTTTKISITTVTATLPAITVNNTVTDIVTTTLTTTIQVLTSTTAPISSTSTTATITTPEEIIPSTSGQDIGVLDPPVTIYNYRMSVTSTGVTVSGYLNSDTQDAQSINLKINYYDATGTLLYSSPDNIITFTSGYKVVRAFEIMYTTDEPANVKSYTFIITGVTE